MCVCADRSLRLALPDDTVRKITGLPYPSFVMAAMGHRVPRASHTWPAFAPDASRIATFEITPVRSAVVVTDLEGVQVVVVAELPGHLPIYLQWSLDGTRIAVVSQYANQLHLTVGSADGSSEARVLATGSPLFFRWLPDGRIAAFIGGGSPQAKMVLLDPTGRRPDALLPGLPGDFCAPVRVGDSVLYGAHHLGSSTILRYQSGCPLRSLPGGEGLMAFLPSPGDRWLARAVAPHGDGTPYQNLVVVDLETKEEHPVADTACLAFFWAGEDALIVARIDTDRGLVEWLRYGLDGEQQHLMDLIPSRDLRFYLRFFEQYASSHPLIDPQGHTLLLAGVNSRRTKGPALYQIDLQNGESRLLGPGHFACFAPSPAAEPSPPEPHTA